MKQQVGSNSHTDRPNAVANFSNKVILSGTISSEVGLIAANTVPTLAGCGKSLLAGANEMDDAAFASACGLEGADSGDASALILSYSIALAEERYPLAGEKTDGSEGEMGRSIESDG